MTKKRFIIDDVGTLIDMQTRNTYDYVSDVCPLLNALNEENEQLKQSIWKCRLCGNTGTIEHIAKRKGDVE